MIEKIIQIVKDASVYMRLDTASVEEKTGVENIVTSADLAVQKYLEERLLALVPDADFYGEEGDKHETGREYRFIVDPIDGTTNFARGLREACISVALAKDGEVILGVVYNPYKDETFWAEKGKGAHLNGKPIHVSETPFEKALVCTALCQYYKQYTPCCHDIFMDLFYACNDFRRFGSCALELCYLAAGRADLYFELRVFPWDHAAASFILKEAGGTVGTFDGSPLTYTHSIPVVGANTKENFDRLVACIGKHLKEIPYED